ncbi:hypothetical protein GGTG_06624 [Gaeumannomyces tritici R3-111a-1]|uniref:Uncharacterized protein n=1 Tax=Gaeumannomyces tritici (strain R3-111a-1) TaxID=644352 RepID=J3NZC5_GAET3|nr:hypothetical protein GGTG_06624 [Gaeumannomyces tritici R3-111a-1]EJT76708.1 hypothetical protein GGTG_06624 [Gaeumannomyces tritici R3-111a-1]
MVIAGAGPGLSLKGFNGFHFCAHRFLLAKLNKYGVKHLISKLLFNGAFKAARCRYGYVKSYCAVYQSPVWLEVTVILPNWITGEFSFLLKWINLVLVLLNFMPYLIAYALHFGQAAFKNRAVFFAVFFIANGLVLSAKPVTKILGIFLKFLYNNAIYIIKSIKNKGKFWGIPVRIKIGLNCNSDAVTPWFYAAIIASITFWIANSVLLTPFKINNNKAIGFYPPVCFFLQWFCLVWVVLP